MDPEETDNAAPEAPAAEASPAAGPPKSRLVYILLGIFLGTLGIHNFYAGHTQKAVIQLILGILCLTAFISWVWMIIDICTVTEDGNGVPFQ